MDNPAVITELQNALNIIMSPNTEPNLRRSAYQYCEDFKEQSENCAECGILMARIENDQIVRHFGLQLLEHCVKFKWNDMSVEKKQFIKSNTLSLIGSGTLEISQEHGHIKDALSRIVVEIAKREWPQQWSFMISELDSIGIKGMTQMEIVLMIFLRLAEDILIFQTPPAQRRKEIMQGITSIMPQLFAFFISTLVSNYEAFKMSREDSGHVRILTITCEVIGAFIESISINLLISEGGRLIFLLIELLKEPQLGIASADCLLEIASKKGKAEDRSPLIDLFLSVEALNELEQVAIFGEKNCTNERGYLFFKKLCQVLVVVGTQISSVLTYALNCKFPANFDRYIRLMFSFTIHSSQVVSCFCQPLWASLLKCERIITQEVIKQCISQYFSSSIEMTMRIGSPAHDNHIKCTYSRFDFDCEEEFFIFQRKYKVEVCDVLRLASALYPEMAFEFISVRLAHLLNKTFNSGPEVSSAMSMLYLEWESMVSCLEAVLEKMDFQGMNENTVQSTTALYKQVLEFFTPDPILCSHVLSVVSAFFPIINKDTSILPTVLDRLFACIVFNLPGQTKSTRSKPVKNVRRHACSILIKICRMYPDVLLPGFNYLYEHIKKMSTNPEELSQMEKCTCHEALILIHNNVKNYVEQANFLRGIIQPITTYWLSDSLTETLWSADKLMDFVGVTRPPVEPSSQDVCGINRSQIQYCLSFIFGVLKRSTWPSSVEEAQSGGFIQGYTYDNSPIYRSPAADVVLPLLTNVFAIIKSYHEFFLPEKYSKIYPDFISAFQLTPSEKSTILGIVKPMGGLSDASIAVTKDPVERMQAFFITLSDASYSILGSCCKYLNQEFYALPSLNDIILDSILGNLFILPEIKIKHILHTFLKPLAQNCPKEYYSSFMLPILKAISPFFYKYLTSKWQQMASKRSEGQDTSQDCIESQENQEMLEELLLKSLTREYFEFIDCILKDKKSQQQQPSNGTEASDDVMMEDGDININTVRRSRELGELGQLLLQHDDVYAPIVLLVFVSLSWGDTMLCSKNVIWCYPILKQLVALQKVTSEYASDFFRSILYGLNVHGQHETVLFIIITALVQTYELLIPHFPSVREVMLQIPGCTEDSLNTFNARLANPNSMGKNVEKKKREYFKTMVDGAIEKNIGQRYKNPIHIKNLAPFRLFRQKQTELLLQDDVKDLGLCSLFAPGDC